jgi:hypothetical protein
LNDEYISKQKSYISWKQLLVGGNKMTEIGQTIRRSDTLAKPGITNEFKKYISQISKEKLKEFMIAINKITIGEGLQDVKEIRQDTML